MCTYNFQGTAVDDKKGFVITQCHTVATNGYGYFTDCINRIFRIFENTGDFVLIYRKCVKEGAKEAGEGLIFVDHPNSRIVFIVLMSFSVFTKQIPFGT